MCSERNEECSLEISEFSKVQLCQAEGSYGQVCFFLRGSCSFCCWTFAKVYAWDHIFGRIFWLYSVTFVFQVFSLSLLLINLRSWIAEDSFPLCTCHSFSCRLHFNMVHFWHFCHSHKSHSHSCLNCEILLCNGIKSLVLLPLKALQRHSERWADSCWIESTNS